MSRTFSKNTSNVTSLGSDAVSPLLSGAAQISFFAWIYPTSLDSASNSYNVLIQALIDGTGTSAIFANIDDSGANPFFRFAGRSQTADSFQVHTGSTTLSLNAWSAVGGVLDIANDDIRTYVNGASDGNTAVTFGAATYADDGTPTGIDRIGSGSGASTTTQQFAGDLAEFAIWNVDIGSGAFSALADGVSLLDIYPGARVLYWPIWGEHSPEIEFDNQKTFTITGSLPKADHAPIIVKFPLTVFSFDELTPLSISLDDLTVDSWNQGVRVIGP